MQAYVFTSLAQAQAAVASMDSAACTGPYPKAGASVGGGIHAPPSASNTTTYGAIYQNAAGTQWAYVDDAVSGQLLPLHIPVPGVVKVDMSPGGNWAGAIQVWP